MSDHETHDKPESEKSETVATKTPTPSWGYGLIVAISIITAIIFAYVTRDKTPKEPETSATTSATSTTAEALPAVIYATTPIALTLNYPFNIETEQEILVKYPGEQPILYNGKCQKLPQPEMYGQKVFTDPKDEVNGHIPFRIYPIRIGDVPPCT